MCVCSCLWIEKERERESLRIAGRSDDVSFCMRRTLSVSELGDALALRRGELTSTAAAAARAIMGTAP